MEAIILAGGFGKRLQKIVGAIPKPMAPVNNRPFLDYLLDYLIINSSKLPDNNLTNKILKFIKEK